MTPEEQTLRYSPLSGLAQELLEALSPSMSREERRETVTRYFVKAIEQGGSHAPA